MSSEAVRMFRAMAKEEITETGEREGEKPFTSYVQAFILAASLGIITDSKRSPKEKKDWLIRGEYLAPTEGYKAMRQLLKSKFDLKSERQVLDLIVEYAEAGVKELYNEYRKTGDIDFLRIARLT